MNNFDKLVETLREAGYSVKPFRIDDPNYRAMEILGKNIRGGFAEKNDHSYRQLSGNVAADNSECFNKWSQCPLVVEIPSTDEDRDKLIGYLNWLGTDEACEWSGRFEFYDDPKLPRIV